MNFGGFIVSFTVFWWIIFFISLPIGIISDNNPEKGHFYGAPKNPNVLKKIIFTTIISLILTLIFEISVHYLGFNKYLEKFIDF